MSRRLTYLFILFFFAGSGRLAAQSLSYQFSETFDPAYDFKPDEAYKIYKESNGAKNQEELGYWVKSVYNTQYNFDNNLVYMDWYAAENYLARLLDTIIPDTVKLKKYLSVYIARDFYVEEGKGNGLFYFDIGLFERSRDEATLCYLLAHKAAHYLLHHRKRLNNYVINTGGKMAWNGVSLNEKEHGFEIEADKYAMACLMRLGLDIKNVTKELRHEGIQSTTYSAVIKMLESTSTITAKTSAENLKAKNREKLFNENICGYGSYDMYEGAMLKTKRRYKSSKRYLVDSVFFQQLRASAKDEIKKVHFEKAEYHDCLVSSFSDYLRRPKDLKNLYYLMESLRRSMYVNPELIDRPFLTHYISSPKMYEMNTSVFELPACLWSNLEDSVELKDHPFFTTEGKPFQTYRQAFDYFTATALHYNMNEGNLSRALFFYQQKQQDSLDEYLNTYITKGNGLYIAYASSFKGKSQPTLTGKRTCILIDNTGNYTYDAFNYYLSKQRLKYNAEIRAKLVQDSTNTDLIVMNELLGKRPGNLSKFRKIEDNLLALYSEEDIQTFKKIRLTSKDKQDELGLSHKFNKNFLVLAPELYPWMKENEYKSIFFVETTHQSLQPVDDDSFYNTYTGYYLDANAYRPYFKDAVRGGMKLKQSNGNMYTEIADFLYGRE
jgi:hypothetical protein